jgi:uncharacterized membrane protein YbhN (UPF0104 family)
MKRPSAWVQFFKWAIVIAALAYLVGSGNLSWTHLQVRPGGYLLVAGAALLTVLNLTITFVRFWLLLQGARTPVSLPAAMQMGFIGAFFNSFLMGGIGGDVVKLVYVVRETGSRATALAGVMMDRVVGLLGLLLLGALAFLTQWGRIANQPSLHELSLVVFGILGAVSLSTMVSLLALAKGRKPAAVLWLASTVAAAFATHREASAVSGLETAAVAWSSLVALGCILVVPSCQPGRSLEGIIRRQGEWGEKLLKLIQSVLIYRDGFGIVVVALVMSFVAQAIGVGAVFMLGQALNIPSAPRISHVFLSAPPALIANALPMPGGGLGVGEAAFDRILSLCRDADGRSIRGGASIFLTLRFVTIVVGLLGLPFYLLERRRIPPQELQAAAVADS